MSSISLINKHLFNVDPFDEALDVDTKKMILEECRNNPAYFFEIIDSKNTHANYQQGVKAFTLMDDMVEPCKLCGSKGVLEETVSNDRHSHQVQCSNKDCILNNYSTWFCNEWDAIKEWNGVKEELARQQLHDELIETSVLISTPQEYLLVLELYLLAGVKVWPWHKGFKPPQEDNEVVGLYTWKEVGFFKELYPVVLDDEKLLTIPELANIVFKHVDVTKMIMDDHRLMINHYLILNNIINQLDSGPVPTSFIESILILDMDFMFLKMVYLTNQVCTLYEHLETFLQYRIDFDRGVSRVVSSPEELFNAIKEAKYHLVNGQSKIPNDLKYYFQHCALDNTMDTVIKHLKSICLTNSIGEVSILLNEYLPVINSELSNEKVLFLNDVVRSITTPSLKVVK